MSTVSTTAVEPLRRPRAGARGSLFGSFWLAGFESATHVNVHGRRLDMIASTQHDRFAREDYARAAAMDMRWVRDGVRWHLIERGGRFDFASLKPMVEAAVAEDVRVIWNLCHYGWPDDLDVFSPAFPRRLARFARAVARFIAEHDPRPAMYVPVNEISFLAWAAGDVGYIHPFGFDRGWALKQNLVRAAVEASHAVWSVDPRARIVHVDPLIHVVPPRGQPELAAAAAAKREEQFQSWDMLSGRICPELGGSERVLDVMGVNYYHNNQWELEGDRLRWEDSPRDERFVPLSGLLAEIYERYRRPLLMAETSHFGVGRAPWLAYITGEVEDALHSGVPIEGICLYPALDRHDWDNPNHWHNSGLWDVRPASDGTLHRVLNRAYAAQLLASQRRLARLLHGPRRAAG